LRGLKFLRKVARGRSSGADLWISQQQVTHDGNLRVYVIPDDARLSGSTSDFAENGLVR
jgi:hypothetical protein